MKFSFSKYVIAPRFFRFLCTSSRNLRASGPENSVYFRSNVASMRARHSFTIVYTSPADFYNRQSREYMTPALCLLAAQTISTYESTFSLTAQTTSRHDTPISAIISHREIDKQNCNHVRESERKSHSKSRTNENIRYLKSFFLNRNLPSPYKNYTLSRVPWMIHHPGR